MGEPSTSLCFFVTLKQTCNSLGGAEVQLLLLKHSSIQF